VKEIPDAPLRPIDRAAGWFILAVGCLGTLIALGLIGYGLVTRDASDLIIGPLAAGGAVWLTVLTLRAFRRDTRVLMPGIQARLESAIARANAEPPAQPRVRFPGDEQVATLMVRRTMGDRRIVSEPMNSGSTANSRESSTRAKGCGSDCLRVATLSTSRLIGAEAAAYPS